MSQVIDNLIAYRVLSMLVKPFKDTDAYKLGIIDDKGNNLIKSRDFTKQEQKDAYNYLTRLVFNLKKLLGKLPGGDNKLKNLIAALFLIKEAHTKRLSQIDESRLLFILDLMESGICLAEEQLIVEDFLLVEDVPTNVTGANVSTDEPVIRKKKPRRFARFVVNDEVYNKFTKGKTKFRKWSSYLNMEDEGQREIYKFAKRNHNGVIILHNGKDTKSIRFNRRGGGNWSKIKRPTK